MLSDLRKCRVGLTMAHQYLFQLEPESGRNGFEQRDGSRTRGDCAARRGKDRARAIGSDSKDNISIALYAFAIPLAFASEWIALGLYVTGSTMWFIPDRRIEKALKE
jgi:hypothetical protein